MTEQRKEFMQRINARNENVDESNVFMAAKVEAERQLRVEANQQKTKPKKVEMFKVEANQQETQPKKIENDKFYAAMIMSSSSRRKAGEAKTPEEKAAAEKLIEESKAFARE